jgi:hypothetical protein
VLSVDERWLNEHNWECNLVKEAREEGEDEEEQWLVQY